ncbi:MAG TPA: hypothetical protein DHV62_02880 [Elusimicrobia bacterium]|jgi:16S rRNA (uracil1498-N3)-methyltransferase|nr:hypothetical protein [Elusimicrobiota bacterium]
MTQFFVFKENINGNIIKIVKDEARHLFCILRKKVGEQIQVFDGSGGIYQVRVEKINQSVVETKILSKISFPEPKFKLHLFPAILKNLKMDYLIQKVVELGVEEITPLITKNTVVYLNSQASRSKVSRWQKIALNAVKQSGGARLPLINLPLDFSEAIEKLNPGQKGGINLIFWEKEKKNNLREFFSTLRSPLSTINYQLSAINLFIGPEGSFSKEEISQTKKYNFIPIGLGGHILRSETAAIVATTLVLYECNELR